MNHKNIIKVFAAMLLTAPLVFTASCSTDEYAKLNTNPATINKADIKYLFTQEQISYQPFDYLLWYYDANYTSHFAQAYTPAGSFSDLFNQIGALGGAGSRFVEVKKYENEINKTIAEMDAEKAKGYQDIKAMANALSVYMALYDCDMYGSMPYSEAVQFRYGGTLTPKYDSQKELFTKWIEEIDADIKVLSAKLESQASLGNNDLAYNGDAAKWLKFANGVKLKLAVRLLHQNKALAIKLAEQVGSNDNNVMSAIEDDYVYNKGTGGDGGNNTYGNR